MLKKRKTEELKKLVQVEFKENQAFDKKSKDVIRKIVEKIKEKLNKSDIEKCSEVWKKFKMFKQEEGENAQTFVTRFEQMETQLKNLKIIIPNKILAIHLLQESNLEEQ